MEPIAAQQHVVALALERILFMKAVLSAFNRGRISPLALARTDFKRTAMSAEVMTNFMPRALGSMMLRPGMGYIGATKSNAAAFTIPFVFATDDTARLELTDSVMRVWKNDALITRPSVTSAITNGTFTTDVASWTDVDTGSAVSDWVAPGFMRLTGTGSADARRRQQVTCSGGNIGVVHALNIDINRGPVLIRVGSSAGGEQYVAETSLSEGYHSLAFTPTGDFYIDLFSYKEYGVLINSIVVASAGAMELTTPWVAASLDDVRWDQSGDVVFVACTGVRQRRIERRDNDSWSVVVYYSEDGPFMTANTGPITLTPSATSAQGDLTASAAMFTANDVGALYKLTHTGQTHTVSATGANQFSSSIRVTGTGTGRAFAVVITGTFVGTVTLQYSVSTPGNWLTASSWTAPVALSYEDGLDNQIIYYRIGIKTAEYTSGTAVCTVSSPTGSQTGICRVVTIASTTVANVVILSDFGDTTATDEWSESYWSARRGYPSSTALFDGRLCWAGKDRFWASVSDSFHSFDDTVEGDSGPINRSIGSGPVDKIYWMLALDSLILGAGGRIWEVRSTSFEEPITPTNVNIKPCGQGSSSVGGVLVDKTGAYVQKSGAALFEVKQGDNYKYDADDLAKHVPEIGDSEITRLAVQQQPETRIHCVRADGTAGILVFDPREEVQCWVDFETDGLVEDVIIEPGSVEDKVTYLVKRTINGSTVRYFERWAKESECVGGTLNKQADSFISASGSGATITGLSHLAAETVVCWADGQYKGSFTVTAGAISQAYTTGYVVGLPYTAQFKSSKLAAIIPEGAGLLCQKKRIAQLGIIARNIHPTGLEYGPDFDNLDALPLVEDGVAISTTAIREAYDEPMFPFDGSWDSDSRLCLQATAPKPVTLLACVLEL
jgi:hypothetical protein